MTNVYRLTSRRFTGGDGVAAWLWSQFFNLPATSADRLDVGKMLALWLYTNSVIRTMNFFIFIYLTITFTGELQHGISIQTTTQPNLNQQEMFQTAITFTD